MLLNKMDLKPQISWLKCSTLWKLISGHCPLYNTTGQLRTLHTIEGFEHGHMQQWPLTSPSLSPSYQRVGNPTFWIKATNTNKHSTLICSQHWWENKRKKSTSGLHAFRPLLVDYRLLVRQCHFSLPESTDIIANRSLFVKHETDEEPGLFLRCCRARRRQRT